MDLRREMGDCVCGVPQVLEGRADGLLKIAHPSAVAAATDTALHERPGAHRVIRPCLAGLLLVLDCVVVRDIERLQHPVRDHVLLRSRSGQRRTTEQAGSARRHASDGTHAAHGRRPPTMRRLPPRRTNRASGEDFSWATLRKRGALRPVVRCPLSQGWLRLRAPRTWRPRFAYDLPARAAPAPGPAEERGLSARKSSGVGVLRGWVW